MTRLLGHSAEKVEARRSASEAPEAAPGSWADYMVLALAGDPEDLVQEEDTNGADRDDAPASAEPMVAAQHLQQFRDREATGTS